jgi:hypothetical protein
MEIAYVHASTCKTKEYQFAAFFFLFSFTNSWLLLDIVNPTTIIIQLQITKKKLIFQAENNNKELKNRNRERAINHRPLTQLYLKGHTKQP